MANGQLWLHDPMASPSLLRLSVEPAPESEITALFEDSVGVLWVGSYTSGLFRARSLSPLLRRELAPDPLPIDLPIAACARSAAKKAQCWWAWTLAC